MAYIVPDEPRPATGTQDGAVVVCRVHGLMKYREPFGWWECPGFDGEGCGVQIVYLEDVRLGRNSGIPGVEVLR